MRREGGRKESESTDVIVIGAGSAGMSAALAARAEGVRVILVEHDKLGGECPNWACVPSKAMLRAARAYREVRRAGLFGVSVKGVSHDFAAVMRYRGDVVDRITGGGAYGERYMTLAKKQGIEVVHGKATFVDVHTVRVSGRTLKAKAFVIATGTENVVPPIEGLAGSSAWGFKDVMQVTRQPKSLLVLGGGPVGCEMATFFASMGTRVTLLQGSPAILPREDAEVSALAKKAMEGLGVEVRTSAEVVKVEEYRRGFSLRMKGVKEPVVGGKLLVAVGKRPATDGLELAKAKVKTDERGWITVDETQATSSPHVFSAGDVTGGMQFTHVAHPEGDAAGYNAAMKALGKKSRRTVDLSVVPRVTFVSPEVASVGLTEEEAKKKYKKLLVGSFAVGSLGRAVTESDRTGFVKLVADRASGKIVGGHIVAARAGEMIHEVALAMKLGATLDDIADLIHAFPTYSEALPAAAASVVEK